jgi:MoaA/NifB/PqqE/SkfB family radical SAM enzyme
MFGITNSCTLSCDFCSRDRDADSAWDIESAYSMLAGLATAGLLEVALGGGEPLAFRGFDELITRLADTTPLALNLTTNGTPLTPARISRLARALGELRLSIDDDNAWPDRAELLAPGGVRFGANVLVTPARAAFLPSRLERLAALGCRDVALLSYVGRDPALHLCPSDDERLADIVADSPLQVRVSRCFGDHGIEVTGPEDVLRRSGALATL